MNELFMLLLMLFCHIIDDYYLQVQGILASMKQKEWWKKQSQYSQKYKYDYIAALAMHSLSWAFMIMLPIAIGSNFNVGLIFGIVFVINALIHGVVDNLKANKYKINLIQDQTIHIAQIIATFLIFHFV